MTPEEKSEQLINKFYDINPTNSTEWGIDLEMAKQCALIAVDEILDGYRKILPSSRNYWEQVKTEIEKSVRHR